MKKLFLIGVCFCMYSFSVRAATITVTSSGDETLGNGDGCSLREAIINTNNDTNTYSDCAAVGSYGNDTIIFASATNGNICLELTGSGESDSETGDLNIKDNLVVSGNGSSLTVIDGNCVDALNPLNDHIFDIETAGITVTFEDLTIQHGVTDSFGGGIYFNEGNLIANHVQIKNNSAVISGGGISMNGGTLDLNDVVFEQNEVSNSATNDVFALGGGLYAQNLTSASVVDSSFIDNTASATSADEGDVSTAYVSGGGAEFDYSTVEISNTTFSGNTVSAANADALVSGGGLQVGYRSLDNEESTLAVSNSTFSENSVTSYNAYAQGGGIYIYNGIASSLNNLTVVGNTVVDSQSPSSLYTFGGGIYFYDQTNTSIKIKLKNSIVAGNTANNGPDMDAVVDSYGYNIIYQLDETYLVITDVENSNEGLLEVDPLLSVLADNGGLTQTRSLGADSPAIDAGSCTDIAGSTIATDQRGVRRISPCDIGAYEYAVCGDHVKQGDEDCDDVNVSNNDNCSNSCVSQTEWFLDSDGDGFGDAAVSTWSHTKPSGYVANSTDCDDSSASISPDDTELCGDSIDNDCDGDIDEGFSDVGDSCSTGVGACKASGTLVCSTDGLTTECDATAGSATTEICSDKIDNDCDGDVDADDSDCKSSGGGGCQLNANTAVVSDIKSSLALLSISFFLMILRAVQVRYLK